MSIRKELKELQLTTFGLVFIEGIGLVAKLTDEDVTQILDVTRQEIPEAVKAERERILNQMALERCDPDVMPYFEDFYWLPESIWQSLKGE